jgi:hypothetical protein
MRSTILTLDPPTTCDLPLADAPYVGALPGLGVNELEAAGWGASWQPGCHLPARLAADDVGLPDRAAATASEGWRSWLIREGSSP